VKTPHNLPLMIEFEGGKVASPYLKELLKNPEIEFYDFTLEGPHVFLNFMRKVSDFDEDEYKYLDEDAII
jgi:hypothetical protein